eukprot:65516_1
MPTTSIPTTFMPTLFPLTSNPTSNIPTTSIPTTTMSIVTVTVTVIYMNTSSENNGEGGVTEIDSTLIEKQLIIAKTDDKFDMILILIVVGGLLVCVVGLCFCICLRKRKRFIKVQRVNNGTVQMHVTNNSSKVEKHSSKHVQNGTLGRNLQSMITGNDLMMEDIINDVDNVQHVVVTKGGNDTNDSETMENSIDDDNIILDGITLGGDNEDMNSYEGDNSVIDNSTLGVMTKGNLDMGVDTESAESDDEIIDDEITITQR